MRAGPFIVITLLSQLVFGQSNPYRFSDQIFSDYKNDTTQYGCQEAAWLLSNIGEYKQMLSTWDTCKYFDVSSSEYHLKTYFHEPLPAEDSIYFSRFKPQDAVSYIAGKAKDERIIIINEAHQQPLHRVFTESILQSLYDNGFRYFGVETLDYHDSLLNERKYPVFKSGSYSVEPQYGNLIRKALEIGFYVFPYESKIHGDPRQREIEQANNIKSILIKDTAAKILIHCGWGHVIESYYNLSTEYVMAGRLKECTGIDPMTIDQTKLTESGSPDFDDPYFKQTDLDYDAVFVDSSGQTFNGDRWYKKVDMLVFHPGTKWVYGRPDWVFDNNKTPVPIVAKIKLKFPCLVFAYKYNEDLNTAVPVDVIEIRSGNEDKCLALYKGNYTIVIKNKQGKDQRIKISND
jgi:hypothetical protein